MKTYRGRDSKVASEDKYKEWEELKALVEEVGLDSRRKLTHSIELCRGFFKARITCEINQEMIKAKVSKLNREEAMIAALRILLNKLRNRCFPTLVDGVEIDPIREITRILSKDSYKARVTCEINKEIVLKANVDKGDRDEAMIAAVRKLVIKMRKRYFSNRVKSDEKIGQSNITRTTGEEGTKTPDKTKKVKQILGIFTEEFAKRDGKQEDNKFSFGKALNAAKEFPKDKSVKSVISRKNKSSIKTEQNDQETKFNSKRKMVKMEVTGSKSKKDKFVQNGTGLKTMSSYFSASEVQTNISAIKSNQKKVKYNTPSIDELLRRPDRPVDGGKTKDEILDELDADIAKRQAIHVEEMNKIDLEIKENRRKRNERRLRYKQNGLLRDRLERELTEVRLRKMFKKNKDYLQNIFDGKIKSKRHEAFHKSVSSRQSLFYTIITDPFTDQQLDWVLEEMSDLWMRNKREHMENNEYVWKVLLPECFIKLYMDMFGMEKEEAEIRIEETPLHGKDRQAGD